MTDPSLNLTLLFGLLLVAGMLTRGWLASRQIRHVARHRNAVPDPFSATINLVAHQKAADYTISKTRFGLIESTFEAALLLGWTLLGGLHALNQALLTVMAPGLLQQLTLLGAFAAIGGLLGLPFSWWRSFRLEAHFGFNRMGLGLWCTDGIKNILVATALLLPVAALVLWLMAQAGSMWWLWAWAAWMAFSLLMMVLYPSLIAPLFNRFEPLKDEAVRKRVSALMQRCGFSTSGLYVMDGSKRSAHANAYFTGFGAAKRVVFFDTLLKQLGPDQIDAVLAHELGHYKLRHIPQRLLMVSAVSGLGFALLGWLANQLWFYTGLGVMPAMGAANDALALILFMLALPLLSYFLTPLTAQLSRRHEFEADAYAVAQTSAHGLRQALLTLYQDNASTLTPDPWFVRFYYSHPPAQERIGRLSGAAL